MVWWMFWGHPGNHSQMQVSGWWNMIIYPDTCHVCDDQLPALFDIYDILYDIHASIAFCSHRISLPCMLFSVYLFDYAATPQHPEAAASKSTHAQQRSSATTEMIHRIQPVGICGLCLLSILEILVIVHSVILFQYIPSCSICGGLSASYFPYDQSTLGVSPVWEIGRWDAETCEHVPSVRDRLPALGDTHQSIHRDSYAHGTDFHY